MFRNIKKNFVTLVAGCIMLVLPVAVTSGSAFAATQSTTSSIAPNSTASSNYSWNLSPNTSSTFGPAIAVTNYENVGLELVQSSPSGNTVGWYRLDYTNGQPATAWNVVNGNQTSDYWVYWDVAPGSYELQVYNAGSGQLQGNGYLWY
ncbi:hypothetical protein [Ferroacidibacillus organovorans]|uniref:Uncharacterized protein n=1 Tax=Ferroacidibacillus organovorans TaxID=1765683 RepID=A0A101XQZ9_9BACL|nr:hypothetical protein [Ferroacidibacillus organovorans]KUO95940.1 hypothetical protein ATW55_02335 [Ferroacidibacillus organovorans]